MKQPSPYCLAVAIPLLAAAVSSVRADDAVSERIYFVQQDGRHAMVYTTSRTDYSDYSLWFSEKEGYQPEDYLENFLYLFPQSGEWSNDSKPGYRALKLPQGNFAALVSMLTTQDLFALGFLQLKGQEAKEPDLELAKYNIDMLQTLEEKTKGNLSPEEDKVLSDTLNQLRMGYVQVSGT